MPYSWSWSEASLLGSILSATDPVAGKSGRLGMLRMLCMPCAPPAACAGPTLPAFAQQEQ